MKFFTIFFNSIKYKSSINFALNLFFIRHMLSININHTLTPYFFLPTKSLKLKYLASNVNFLYFFNVVTLSLILFVIFYSII